MEKLKFYDLKKKKSFYSDDYEFVEMDTSKGTRYFVVTISPSGNKSYRVVSKDFYDNN